MLFRTYFPSEPLSRFVEMFWFYSGPGPVHRRERVLPDGTAELVINLDDVPRKRFDRHNPRRVQTVRRAWISGAQPEFILIDVLPQASMVGAHFKPGGLTPFVKMPARELCGQIVELDALWGRAADDLRDAMLESPTLAAKFQVLEGFLLRQALRPLCPDSPVAAALRLFEDSAAVARIENVARLLGMSHKHFIERFRAEVGLSPKRFCRIRRFQRALGDIQARRSVDWTDVAYASGYCDQSHLIHDFRAFSGLTPTEYAGQAGADARFVPITDGG
jgi:AraC-like DNA-binding protein